MDILPIIKKALENVGIDIGNDLNLDTDLREYVNSSVLFISFIVEIEEMLHIEFPDELLLTDTLSSLGNLCKIVKELVDQK